MQTNASRPQGDGTFQGGRFVSRIGDRDASLEGTTIGLAGACRPLRGLLILGRPAQHLGAGLIKLRRCATERNLQAIDRGSIEHCGGRGTRFVKERQLSRVPDVHHIPILHDVIFAFEPQRAFGAGVSF
jgi:hypothetical protein